MFLLELKKNNARIVFFHTPEKKSFNFTKSAQWMENKIFRKSMLNAKVESKNIMK